MARGKHQSTDVIYLSIGFGKIRQKRLDNGQKVDKDTPDAVCRKTQQGQDSWAIEYDFVNGVIENIFHKEDDYGNSFEVVLVDGIEKLQVSFRDDSRFWFDFAEKLPNIDLNKEVVITAYDFEDKEGKRRVGTSVKQGEEKIYSYYNIYENDKWSRLHGFPSGDDVNFKDTDEVKMYNIKVKKFLKDQFHKLIEPKLENTEKEFTKSDSVGTNPQGQKVYSDEATCPDYDENNPPPPNEQDLPFN